MKNEAWSVKMRMINAMFQAKFVLSCAKGTMDTMHLRDKLAGNSMTFSNEMDEYLKQNKLCDIFSLFSVFFI